jgi:hypothetical protein
MGQHFSAPPVGEPHHPFIKFQLVSLPLPAILVVRRKDVSDVNFLDITQAPLWPVLVRDVCG